MRGELALTIERYPSVKCSCKHSQALSRFAEVVEIFSPVSKIAARTLFEFSVTVVPSAAFAMGNKGNFILYLDKNLVGD
jgi:hypothetical protein